MSPERKQLQILEMSGQYVFHGTGEDITVLEPQQAYKRVAGEREKDGPAAIFASSSADYAIFFAVISKKNCPLGRRASVADSEVKGDGYKLKFKASENTLSQLDDASSGWVYVFDRSQFFIRQEGGIEYANRSPIAPLKKIKVTRKDLPTEIEVVI
jgi:hypothetical protein